ncbi:hypothetical protein L1987_39099 [Smallanthus sonchifolius]|uniref:Uncharacterized protein n=1 Tax=Smallanthus sonchifolius TaxID=185202 RepID=A0ACB9HL41_9ASTR|nr:hypothetical protein L1987_39099 [Smallanthus sonchifolius]
MQPTKNCRAKKHMTKKLKVVHISSPMKVKTSASRFRSLVQELTGRDSDISRYNAGYFDPTAPTTSTQGDGHVNSKRPVDQLTQQGLFTGSDPFLDGVLSSEMFDHLDGIFPPYSLYES